MTYRNQNSYLAQTPRNKRPPKIQPFVTRNLQKYSRHHFHPYHDFRGYKKLRKTPLEKETEILRKSYVTSPSPKMSKPVIESKPRRMKNYIYHVESKKGSQYKDDLMLKESHDNSSVQIFCKNEQNPRKNRNVEALKKICKNGHEECPYISCDKFGRPLYGFRGFTSCGKSHKDEFCTHAYCHDNRLKLALGDSYALKAQIHLNETGEYKDVSPLNYEKEGDNIIITKELHGRDVKAKIFDIDWEKNEAILYMTDGGPLEGGRKPFQHIPIKQERLMPSGTYLMKSWIKETMRDVNTLKEKAVETAMDMARAMPRIHNGIYNAADSWNLINFVLLAMIALRTLSTK